MEYKEALRHWGAKQLERQHRALIDESTVTVNFHDDAAYYGEYTGDTHDPGVMIDGKDIYGHRYSEFTSRDFVELVSEIVEIAKRDE